jgi:hypothetical protein
VRVVMSKLGNRAEYTWGEFKRVSRYQSGQNTERSRSSPDREKLADGATTD